MGLNGGEDTLVALLDFVDQLVGELPDAQDVAVAQVADGGLSISGHQVYGALTDVDHSLLTSLFTVADERTHAFHDHGPDLDDHFAVAAIEAEGVPALQRLFDQTAVLFGTVEGYWECGHHTQFELALRDEGG